MTTILCFLTKKYQLSNTFSQRNWENQHRCQAVAFSILYRITSKIVGIITQFILQASLHIWWNLNLLSLLSYLSVNELRQLEDTIHIICILFMKLSFDKCIHYEKPFLNTINDDFDFGTFKIVWNAFLKFKNGINLE